MKTHTVNFGVEQSLMKYNSNALSQVLSNEYLLYLKTLNFHWNITGPSFIALHGLLESQYEWLRMVIDDVAERIRTLGFYAPANYKHYLSEASIVEGDELQTDEQMLAELITSNEFVIKMIRELLIKIEGSGDFGTADLLIKILKAHEKNTWMLRSHLLVHSDDAKPESSFQKAPAFEYGSPKNILENKKLTNEQKTKILISWAKDEENKQKSVEENMLVEGEEETATTFVDILNALRSLGIEYSMDVKK